MIVLYQHVCVYRGCVYSSLGNGSIVRSLKHRLTKEQRLANQDRAITANTAVIGLLITYIILQNRTSHNPMILHGTARLAQRCNCIRAAPGKGCRVPAAQRKRNHLKLWKTV